MENNRLKKECMGIVNQLLDLTEISVEKRQQINDTADNYLLEQVTRLIAEREQKETTELNNWNKPHVSTRICPKAGQCANVAGGLICPKDVICPI